MTQTFLKARRNYYRQWKRWVSVRGQSAKFGSPEWYEKIEPIPF